MQRSWQDMAPKRRPELNHLLEEVSRSFYLTMRVLPKRVRPQVSLAYLLARAADTIADTEIVPVPERLKALGQLRCRILGRSIEPLDFTRLAAAQTCTTPRAERRLLERIEH